MKESGKQELKLKVISISPELQEVQKLMPISAEDREQLKKSIEKNGIRDPLKVYEKKGKYYLLGGWNRLEIARELGIESVNVIIYEGSEKEYKDLAINDNLARRHLSSDEKRNLIGYFLKQDPGKSDRSIADKVDADHKTVNKKRKELVARGEIPHVEKKDSLGRKIPEKKSIDPDPISKLDKEITDLKMLIENKRVELVKMESILREKKAELSKLKESDSNKPEKAFLEKRAERIADDFSKSIKSGKLYEELKGKKK